jgi:hypothetical protein
MTRIVFLFALLLAAPHFAMAQGNRSKKTIYEEVDFEKSFGYSIEGIYFVSCVIMKRSKKFLSKAERIRVVGREETTQR